MRYYLIDGDRIVAESASHDRWCLEAQNVHPDGIITDAPPAVALAAWRSAASDHHYFVNAVNQVQRPFVNAAFDASMLEHWWQDIDHVLLPLDALRERFPALARAWLSGDDRLPDEDERLTRLQREADYLEESWIVNTTYEEWLVRDAARGTDSIAGAVPEDVLRTWFDAWKREVAAALAEMGLAGL